MTRLSCKQIQARFKEGDDALTPHARGKALEDLMIYVMGRIPGVRFQRRNVHTHNNSEEIDLIFWNDKRPDGLQFLPNILMIECKNWSAPVDSAAVTFFLAKLERRHLEYGFLVAATGITGDQADATNAYNHVNHFFTHHRCGLLILTRAELCDIKSSHQFIALVQSKIAELVLGVQ